MRITKSEVCISDRVPYLVKEQSCNYRTDNTALNSPDAVVDVMNNVFNISYRAEEYVYLICLDTKLKPISFFEVSHGTIDSSLVGIREIMLRAILSGARTMILVHNHPSGDCTPSMADVQVTEKLKNACNIMDLVLADHVIIGGNSYYSFGEERKL